MYDVCHSSHDLTSLKWTGMKHKGRGNRGLVSQTPGMEPTYLIENMSEPACFCRFDIIGIGIDIDIDIAIHIGFTG